MPSFNLAATAAYVLYSSWFVSAAPTSSGSYSGLTPSGGHAFSIPQVPNPHFNKTIGGWGPSAYKYAMAKYGAQVHTLSVPPLSQDVGIQKGDIIANPAYAYYDREYVCQVKIGTPAQTLPLDIDSGSSDLWVFSTETPSASVTSGKAIYNSSASTSSKPVSGATWTVNYGDGSSSSGDVFKDNVTLGTLSVSNQGVETAQQVSSQFAQDGASSGLLGLAFSTLNQVRPIQQLTWFDNIKASLTAPLFTADLKKNAPGSYSFGYINTTSYTGDITYVPVNSARYGLWQFNSSGYAVGQTVSSIFTNTIIDAIADTGTSLLLLPSSIVSAYYKQLSGAYYESSIAAYIYPCANTPPAFIFGIGSARQVIPGSYINYGSVGSGYCYGGIQSQGSIPFSIFGDIALKAQFVVFDAGNSRIGWANKKTS